MRLPDIARTLIAGSLVALSATGAAAQTVGEVVDLDDVARIRAEGLDNSHMQELAHHLTDVIGPRLTGSPGMRAANEIVIPTVLMLTVLSLRASGIGEGAGVMFEESVTRTGELLRAGGWTLLTGVNLMLFSLLHNPCSTTIYTIWKETGSAKWTAVATLMPLLLGFVVCFFVAQLWALFV